MRKILQILISGSLLSGLAALAEPAQAEADKRYVPTVQGYVATAPQYVFKTAHDVESLAAKLDGKVMAFLEFGEEFYSLHPRGVFCLNGTPPFVTVDYATQDRREELELLNAIQDYNRGLLRSGRIDAYQCETDDWDPNAGSLAP